MKGVPRNPKIARRGWHQTGLASQPAQQVVRRSLGAGGLLSFIFACPAVFGWQASYLGVTWYTMWYVYVLRSNKDGNLYIGSTKNLKRRLREHKNGECISTAKRLPLSLETYIAVQTGKQARSLERYLKTGSGTAILKKRVLLLQ